MSNASYQFDMVKKIATYWAVIDITVVSTFLGPDPKRIHVFTPIDVLHMFYSFYDVLQP